MKRATKGMMYEYTGEPDGAVSYTRALWIPDEFLLFQWNEPRIIVQVTTPVEYPPRGQEASVTFMGLHSVPNKVVRAARQHLRKLEHVRAQEALLQWARTHNANEALLSEERLRTVLLKAQFPQ